MITTSKGFLDTFINNEEAIVSEGFDLDTELDLIINEDCGDITIGEWAFLQEGDIDDAKVQLLEDVLNDIDADLLEADKFFEGLEDKDNELLDEAVKSSIKKVIKAVGAKAKVAGKAAAAKAKVAGKAAAAKGKIAAEKLKTAAKAAVVKSKEYAMKARELIKKGAMAAAAKAKNMASKLAAKAKVLRDKVKEVILRYKNKKKVV